MIPVFPLPDVERFRQAILRRFGLEFDEGKQGQIAEILRRRIDAGGQATETYLAALEAGGSQAELRALAQELTVTETSFFRNPEQIRAFSQVALPDRLAVRSGHRRLRILSAGCASGEEAYTLAACVRDHPGTAGWDVTIRAVDINVAMLRRAAAGHYSAWSLRQTPAAMRARLFRADGHDFILDPAVREMVTFEERNLTADDGAFWLPDSFDVIFFRNVFMYFSPEVARAVIARMTASLTPGGFLFLGHAETLRGLSTDYHLRHTHGTFYYQRKDAPAEPHGAPSSPEPVAPLPNDPLDALIHGNAAWADTIRQASQRIRTLTREPPRERAAPARGGQAAPAAARAAAQAKSRLDLRAAVDLLGREQYSEVRELLGALPADRARDPEVLLLHAVLHTHGGDLAAAEQACAELLTLDELNAGAHYLMALCRESAGDDPGAVRHDRIAAYLDPGFAMPRLHLGRLARRAGDAQGAARELRQALLLLEREDSARLLLFAGGFSREALMTLCRAQIAAIKEAGR